MVWNEDIQQQLEDIAMAHIRLFDAPERADAIERLIHAGRAARIQARANGVAASSCVIA